MVGSTNVGIIIDGTAVLDFVVFFVLPIYLGVGQLPLRHSQQLCEALLRCPLPVTDAATIIGRTLMLDQWQFALPTCKPQHGPMHLIVPLAAENGVTVDN